MSESTGFPFIGKALPRAEGQLKVTGSATYTAEWDIPDLTYGAVVDSAISRGSIREIDAAQALAAPGVIAIITHENAPRLNALPDHGAGQQITGAGGLGEGRQPLQDGTIYYGAQSIAVVVAKTLEQARYAATLVRVTYDEQPPELAMDTATRQEFPEIFAGTDTLQKSEKEAKAAIEAAPVRVTSDYVSAICHHNPIELLSTIALWEMQDDTEQLTIYDTTRGVQLLRDVCARSFNMPASSVRVISHYLGGAFGAKAWTFFNPLLVALAARVVKRPVKVEWRRQQMYSVAGHRPATKQTFSLGASKDGKITGLIQDSWSHTSPVSGYTEPNMRMPRMMYDIPNIGFSSRLSYLNFPSPCTMRGPGMMAGGWGLECAMDELAHELDIDPVELRLRNYAENNPEGGQPFYNKRLRECYARGKDLFGWDNRPSRPRSTRVGNTFIGYGMSSVTHSAVRMASSAQATIFADGSALVRSATHEIGNGAYTIFRQIAADEFCLPLNKVRFELGDSNFPVAIPAMGSMGTASIGPAVIAAVRNTITALKKLAVQDPKSPFFNVALDAIEMHEGRLQVHDQPGKSEEYGAIVRRAGVPSVMADGEAKSGQELKMGDMFSFGSTFAEVRVDEETGVVRVARLYGVFDPGRLINPKTAYSQLMGAMIYSLGATLMEESLYDPNNGLPVVRNLADYHFPGCADTPQIVIEMLNIPDPQIGELGAHGLGELGGNGVPPAITNAIFNATGKRLRSLPFTPDKVLEG